MATTEYNVLMTHVDENGNKQILYPVTKPENVDGLYDLMKKATPRNLLDNSDFSALIAQAGLNGKHGNETYIGDRWVSAVCTAAQDSRFLRITSPLKGGSIDQRLSHNLAGKTVTVACKAAATKVFYVGVYYTKSDGSTAGMAFSSASGVNGIVCKTGTIPTDATNFRFVIYPAYAEGGGYADVYWVALYEGGYTQETLPVYQPKGYGAELEECQRYYIHGATTSKWSLACCASGGYLVISIPTPVEMRAIPNVIPNPNGTEIYAPGWGSLDVTLMFTHKYPGVIFLQARTPVFPDLTLTPGMSYLVNYLPSLSADLP